MEKVALVDSFNMTPTANCWESCRCRWPVRAEEIRENGIVVIKVISAERGDEEPY